MRYVRVTGVMEPREDLPELRIPERYHAGFAKIIVLDDEQFQQFLSALREQSPALDYEELALRIAPRVSAISQGDIEDILETLNALYGARAWFALSAADFAEIVRRAAEESDAEELRLPSENGARLNERLVQLLDMSTLDATRKARDLLVEHEHTLHSARILTDVRPVFGPNLDDDPTGALIVHMLKLSYHDESEDIKEIYVALDTDDPGYLIDMFRRAESKAESLKRVLGRAKVPYIDVG